MSPKTQDMLLSASGVAFGVAGLVRGLDPTDPAPAVVMFGALVVLSGLGLLIAVVLGWRRSATSESVTIGSAFTSFWQFRDASLSRRVFIVVASWFMFGLATSFIVAIGETKWRHVVVHGLTFAACMLLVLATGGQRSRQVRERVDDEGPVTVKATPLRFPPSEGWYQVDGRWHCAAHGRKYCKHCFE